MARCPTHLLMGTPERTAQAILEEMDKLYSEKVTEPVTDSLTTHHNLGYWMAMSDLRQVIGDMFPTLNQ